MKIAILGRGKMGKTVESVASQSGFEVQLGLEFNTDAIIDFSSSLSIKENYSEILKHSTPWVIGSTGWGYDGLLPELKKSNTPILYCPNFSRGMALFHSMLEMASSLNNQKFNLSGVEKHQVGKKDLPSGTANYLMKKIPGLSFTSVRRDDETSEHHVIFSRKNEKVELKHTVKNREVLAQGALCAAKWLIGRKGLQTYDDFIKSDYLWNHPK